MRLPPPSRKYSPISVMAVTPETVSRPNSRSMAARSSRRSSKTSRPLVAVVLISNFHHGDTELRRRQLITQSHPAGVAFEIKATQVARSSPCLRGESVGPVIRKLHINSKILLPQ